MTVWWTTRKLSEKTWKAALRRLLDRICLSYEWVDLADQTDAPARALIRRLVLRPSAVNLPLSRFGWSLASAPEGSSEGETQPLFTIGEMSVTVALRLRSDFGLFSEPWQVHISDVFASCKLGVDGRLDGHERTEASVGGPIEAVGAVLAEAVASVGGVGGILPVAPAQDGQGCEDDQKDASEGLGRHVAIDSIEEGAGSDAKHSSSGNRLGRGASSERETSTNSHHGVAKPCHVAATSGSVVDTTAPVEHELSEEEADVFEEAEECSDVDMDTNRAVPSRQHRAEDPPAGSGEEDGEEDGWDEEYVSDSEWQQMEAAAAAAARDFAEGSSSTAASRDWLPLHRAAENLRLRLQRVRVIVERG